MLEEYQITLIKLDISLRWSGQIPLRHALLLLWELGTEMSLVMLWGIITPQETF